MLVSVVVTTKDRYELACDALRSVYNQTYSKIEVILVNDGHEYDFSEFEGLIVINNPESLGGSYARNKGVSTSTGEFIFFLDDDDYWREDKIALQMELFQSNKNIGLVYTGRSIFYDGSVEIDRIVLPRESGNLYPRILFENPIGVTSSVGVRRDVFVNSGGFDERLPCRQDYDLWIRICKITEVGFVNQACLFYRLFRVAGKQISNSSERHSQAYDILIDKYTEDFNNMNIGQRRKIKSNLLFSVAKSYRRVGYFCSIQYVFLSLLNYPNIKSFALLLPKFILRKVVSL